MMRRRLRERSQRSSGRTGRRLHTERRRASCHDECPARRRDALRRDHRRDAVCRGVAAGRARPGRGAGPAGRPPRRGGAPGRVRRPRRGARAGRDVAARHVGRTLDPHRGRPGAGRRSGGARRRAAHGASRRAGRRARPAGHRRGGSGGGRRAPRHASSRGAPRPTSQDAARLVEWLVDGRFALLGYRRYGDRGHQLDPATPGEPGLGVLRHEEVARWVFDGSPRARTGATSVVLTRASAPSSGVPPRAPVGTGRADRRPGGTRRTGAPVPRRADDGARSTRTWWRSRGSGGGSGPRCVVRVRPWSRTRGSGCSR